MNVIRKAVLVLSPFLLSIFVLIGLFSFTTPTLANPAQVATPAFEGWVITSVFSESAIAVIDTRDQTVYGPFLEGELGSPMSLLDVVVTPDGKTALVSNFGDSAVYFVDVTDPISPSFIVSVTIPFFAEDIALSPDGRYALVTDGGLASIVATLDVISPTLLYTQSLGARDAQAVAVAPDGTVVVADYLHSSLGVLKLDSGGALTQTQIITQLIDGKPSYPINVAIAPDGETILVSYYFTDAVGVYQILSPGLITTTSLIRGLPGDQQSIAFTPDGAHAIVSSMAPTPTDQVSWLDLMGPGQVVLNAPGIANLLTNFGGGFFGVDVMAVVGGKLYVGNSSSFGMTETLSVVDLNNWGVTAIPLDDYPVGVAVIPPRKMFLPIVTH